MDHDYRLLDLERLTVCMPERDLGYWASSSRGEDPLPIQVWERLHAVVDILQTYEGWVPEGIREFSDRYVSLSHSPSAWALAEVKKSLVDFLAYDIACSGIPEEEIAGLFQRLRRDYEVRQHVPEMEARLSLPKALPREFTAQLINGYVPETMHDLGEIALLNTYIGQIVSLCQRHVDPEPTWVDDMFRGLTL